MHQAAFPDLDLNPPAFAEGLHDWSRAAGAPGDPVWADAAEARLVPDDPDFGPSLELSATGAAQRLRYMGELPLRPGRFLEISARVKALSGAGIGAAMAATPGGAGGRILAGLPVAAPPTAIAATRRPVELRAVIGPAARPGVDLVWNPTVLYAHVGLDLAGPAGGVLRIENLCVRDVTRLFAPGGPMLAGFTPADGRGRAGPPG